MKTLVWSLKLPFWLFFLLKDVFGDGDPSEYYAMKMATPVMIGFLLLLGSFLLPYLLSLDRIHYIIVSLSFFTMYLIVGILVYFSTLYSNNSMTPWQERGVW